MTDHWFRPKTHGYGASPSNWKGWAATLAYVVAVLGITWPLIVLPSKVGSGPGVMQVALFIALSVVLTGVFIQVCKAKTNGEWRWRWGKDGEDQQ